MAKKACITRVFTVEEMDEWDLPWGTEKGMVKVNEIVEHTRWSVLYDLVFQAPDDGKLWRLVYQRPATEMQECDRWPDLEAVQVEAVEVNTVEYRQVIPVGDPH